MNKACHTHQWVAWQMWMYVWCDHVSCESCLYVSCQYVSCVSRHYVPCMSYLYKSCVINLVLLSIYVMCRAYHVLMHYVCLLFMRIFWLRVSCVYEWCVICVQRSCIMSVCRLWVWYAYTLCVISVMRLCVMCVISSSDCGRGPSMWFMCHACHDMHVRHACATCMCEWFIRTPIHSEMQSNTVPLPGCIHARRIKRGMSCSIKKAHLTSKGYGRYGRYRDRYVHVTRFIWKYERRLIHVTRFLPT